MSSGVFALSIHADYTCRHSGACCTADWDVPVEMSIYRSLADAIAAGRLRVAPEAETAAPFLTGPDLPDDAAAILERTGTGNCVFFHSSSRLCIVHRDLGEPALPATCRHFPRVALRDGRGTFITLSHFCPTAASMLFRDDVPLDIVDGPAAFPAADYEGLVVGEDDLPPLLTPAMLMDAEGYSAWERHMVTRCAAAAGPEPAVATLQRDAMLLRTWRPGTVTLAAAIAALPSAMVEAQAPRVLAASLDRHREVMDAVPDDLKPVRDEDGLDEAYGTWVLPRWPDVRRPVTRYLAAKAFASWTAYQGRGVLTIVRGLEAAVALVRVEAARRCRDAARPLDRALLLEAIRSADFALNHLAVGEDLAAAWSRAESVRL